MRRRSVKWRYLGFGVAAFAGALIFFTRIFVPLERFALDTVGGFLLGYRSLEGSDAVFASIAGTNETQIIGKRFDEFRDVMLVAGSYRDGSPVLAGDALIGFVIESGSRVSKVRAIASPGAHTPAVLERSGIPVDLEGKGAGFFEVALPRGSDVSIGDVVRSSDHTTTGEQLAIIGSVVKIDDRDSEPFLRVLVRGSVNLSLLLVVTVHDI